jgi:diazepam-binding inhibitor (GABA receptor modulator, acyl-CoA-binding protein)
MSLDDDFNKCVNYINKSKKINIDNDTKLFFYGHYKQGIIGDCNIDKPTGLFNISNKLKYEAWNNLKGLSKDEAKKKYVEKFKKIINIEL